MKGHTKVERKKKAMSELSRAVFAPPSKDFDSSNPLAPPIVGHDFGSLSMLRPQAKLTVSQPGDRYETEADQIADQVMRMEKPDSKIESAIPRIARKEQSDMQLADDVTPIAQAGLQSSGEPLDAETRAFMEQRFGHDFSQVRLHSGAAAEQSAQDMNANAYTVGHNIVLDSSRFVPGTHERQRLLAHELTHVVQQLNPPKLHGSATSVQFTGNTLQANAVQRDTPEVKPYAGPAPANPFPAPAAGKKIDVSQLVIASLQSLTSDMINHAYTNYLGAVNSVKAKVQGEKKEAEEKEKATRELVLGLVLLPVGLAGPAIGARVMSAMPGMRDTLMKRVENTLPNLLKANGLEAKDAVFLTAEAVSAVDGLIAKLNVEKIGGAVNDLAEKGKGAAAKVSLSGGPFDQALAFLDACAFAADQNSKGLMAQVFITTDFSALLAIYNTFSAASLEVYTADLDGRAHHFMSELSQTPGKIESIVEIDAYGRNRLAKVRYNTTSANYFFIAWVTPDMEPIARQLEPNPRRMPTTMIVNHLPVPMEETGERIVIINAWGKERMALVMVAEGKTGAGRADEVTQYQFVKWFGPLEEVIARTKGAQQIGGLNTLRTDQVRKLQAPQD